MKNKDYINKMDKQTKITKDVVFTSPNGNVHYVKADKVPDFKLTFKVDKTWKTKEVK